MGRDVFCRSSYPDQKRYHLFFGFLIVLFLLTCFASYPEAYSTLPQKVTEEVARYIPIPSPRTVPKPKVEIPKNPHNIYLDTYTAPILNFTSSECPLETWNTIRTSSIPNYDLHKNWTLKHEKYLYHTSLSPLAAFAHQDQIIVTLTSENQFNASVYCRYFDCHRREISDHFESIIFPQSTVFCARRPGAKYISISKTVIETPEYSVPIVPRVERPPHYFTVCMATLYGDEPKFLQIVDFIEYYKLQGATFFHIYLRNVTDYDRVLLDDYVRTGDIEIIKMHDHYWRDDFMWHNAQINDCHHRNKYFSKWTALVDIDERIEMKDDSYRTIVQYLDTIHDFSAVSLHFHVQWVIKQNNTPARYESDEQLTREMLFHKYQNLSQVGGLWDQPKCIIRPEQIGAMTIHVPSAVYSGKQVTIVPPAIGVVRHYRNVEQRVFAGALQRMMSHGPFSIQPIPKWLDEELTKRILKRVKWVYDVVDVECLKKQKMYKKHGGISAPCWLEKQKLKGVTDEPINSSFPIIFYKTAYLDYRFHPPLLRIFSLNGCIPKNRFLSVDLHYKGNLEPIRKNIHGGPLDGDCPSKSPTSASCFYVSHIFYTKLRETEGLEKMTINLDSRNVELKVSKVHKKSEKGLTVCIKPVYYYSQWQNIVLYIESWRAQGATRFIVFYHSATQETRRGLIEFRPWPNFGNLPSRIAAQYPKIDESVRTFGFFLASNLCILDIETTIGAVADFDEIMVPKTGTLLEYATKEMADTNVGALMFDNAYVTMEPSHYTANFSGVESPKFLDKHGPSKYIFDASVIDIAEVHWPESFTDSSKISKNADGALLHFRFNIEALKLNVQKKPYRFFPENSTMHIKNMQETTNKIFQGSTPISSSELQDALEECISKLRVQKNVCRSTGGLCKPEMDKVYDWVYDETEGVFLAVTDE